MNENSPSRELDVSRVAIRPLRNRLAIWKRADGGGANERRATVQLCCETLPAGSSRKRLLGTQRMKAANVYDWTIPHQHESKIRSPSDATGTPPAPKTTETGRVGGSQVLGSVGRIRPACSEVPDWRGRAKLCDVGCHILHTACCEAGLEAQREVIVPALATERVTEPRVDVDAWEAPRSSSHSLSMRSRGCGSHPREFRHVKRRLQRGRKLNEQIQANMDERKAKWRPQEPSSASGPTKRYGAALRSLV